MTPAPQITHSSMFKDCKGGIAAGTPWADTQESGSSALIKGWICICFCCLCFRNLFQMAMPPSIMTLVYSGMTAGRHWWTICRAPGGKQGCNLQKLLWLNFFICMIESVCHNPNKHCIDPALLILMCNCKRVSKMETAGRVDEMDN